MFVLAVPEVEMFDAISVSDGQRRLGIATAQRVRAKGGGERAGNWYAGTQGASLRAEVDVKLDAAGRRMVGVPALRFMCLVVPGAMMSCSRGTPMRIEASDPVLGAAPRGEIADAGAGDAQGQVGDAGAGDGPVAPVEPWEGYADAGTDAPSVLRALWAGSGPHWLDVRADGIATLRTDRETYRTVLPSVRQTQIRAIWSKNDCCRIRVNTYGLGEYAVSASWPDLVCERKMTDDSWSATPASRACLGLVWGLIHELRRPANELPRSRNVVR